MPDGNAGFEADAISLRPTQANGADLRLTLVRGDCSRVSVLLGPAEAVAGGDQAVRSLADRDLGIGGAGEAGVASRMAGVDVRIEKNFASMIRAGAGLVDRV